ncbi:site-2 protease family protein [Nitratireductor aquimarinus]|uniref:site-2 protease family protein n=1 Tax=Nitratireductor TaxID=245876 RepID=UPI0019D3F61F|nr:MULTISPECIES: site-2 protease family protein [Nitratireductor]MBN7775043.1 site-2 protease family protein [Nitratireductor pacificus]MBN7779904.1 site-2 protease family protein [Nitratireductor pacificus]MBN7788711.1 site-2 protease family protein [Nitratireductor aquimarinus]MBY6097430.1 site-2 protease family protein [Nitratireductor aquimarinus]MCA1260918.1 site-2 protease family protein [Nitratireductor aquimarinus]
MGWSFNIGKIGGTVLRVHVTFFLLLVWIWFMHYQIGGTTAAWEGVAFIVAVFACVVLHEFGHALAARHYGIKTPDITLLPIGGLARLERMPEEPRQELVIAIAGPMVNVVIAALIIFALGGTAGIEQMLQVEDPRADFLVRLAGVNIFLVLFNLIPAFPMDGGRVLRALLATRLSWAKATQIAANIGQGLAFLFGFLGLLYNPLLIFIAIFVYLAASAEAQNAQIKSLANSVLAGDVMVTKFATLSRSASIGEAIDLLLATTQNEFPVVDAQGHLEGLITRNDMIRVLRDAGPDAPAASAMRAGLPTIHKQQSLTEGVRLMQETQAPAVAVLDSHERLAGLITHETIGEMIMVRAAMPEGFRFAALRKRNRRNMQDRA